MRALPVYVCYKMIQENSMLMRQSKTEYGRKSHSAFVFGMPALLLGMLLLLFSFCTYADTLNVVIPYDQLWVTDSARANGTFHYTIAPTGGSPAPLEAAGDGIYSFALTGNVQGELRLNVPFDRQGYYTYRSAGLSSETRGNYTASSETYDITVTVQYAAEGMRVASVVMGNSKGTKTDRMYYSVSYTGSGGGGGGGGSGGGGGPTGPGGPGGPEGTPGTEPGTPEEEPIVAGAARSTIQTLANTVGRTAGELIGYVQGPGPASPGGNEGPQTSGETQGDPQYIAPANRPQETTAVQITEPDVPLGPGPGRGAWALFNLLCLIATALEFIIGIILLRRKKQEEDAEEVQKKLEGLTGEALEAMEQKLKEEREAYEEREKKLWKKRRRWRAAGILPAAASIILFILTEDIRLPMIWMDRWSIWMFIIFVIETLMFFHSRYKEVEQEFEDEEEEDEI